MSRTRLASIALAALAMSTLGAAAVQAHGNAEDPYPGAPNPCGTTDPHKAGSPGSLPPAVDGGPTFGRPEIWVTQSQVAYQDNQNHIGVSPSRRSVEFSNMNNPTYLTQAKVSPSGACVYTIRPELPGGGVIHVQTP